ncbi:hypothetical protein Btru_022226 [Bulinus truncatus]|nr:hypothetical protein Btru_022226 [Bulinus truncatus]
MCCMSYTGSTCFWYVVVMLVILTHSVTHTAILETQYLIATGFKLSQGTQLRTVYSNDISAIFCSTLCSSGCGSATYSVKYKTCITFVEKFYNSSIVCSRDLDWEVLYRDELITHGDWTMVFRAQKEINIPLYNAWTATGRHDDSPLSGGVFFCCYRLDNTCGCQQHFRSSILDNWNNIKQVRFSLYVNESEVNYIVFNGTSTLRDSWFQRSKILNSSWSSIKTDNAIKDFTIIGYTRNSSKRRFVICGSYGSCSTDLAYFLAVDQSYDLCEVGWRNNVTNYPVFIFGKNKNGLSALNSTMIGKIFS